MHILPGDTGCVIGTLFHRYGAPIPLERLDYSDGRAIHSTGGRHLIDRFWGQYIALLRLTDGTLALRDPSGMLPCVYTNSGSLICLASDPALLVEAGLLRAEVDDCGVARALLFPGFPDEKTALRRVKYLRPGTGVYRRSGTSDVKTFWTPWSFVSTNPEVTAGSKAEELERTIQQCVTGWSRQHDRGLVCVSGGLDSSIVASALSRSGNHLSCLTLVTDDKLGDERHYCATLAEHLNADLVVERYNIVDIRLDVSSVVHQARPFGRPDALAYDAALVRTARKLSASCVFSGHGGDNVFYMSHSARPVVDRLLTDGFSAGIWNSIHDIAELTGESVFKVMRHALRNWRRRSEPYCWRPSAAYLSPDLVEKQLAEPAHHPWLNRPEEGSLPGKSAQIAMLLRMQHSTDAYLERCGMPIIHPLVSQPIVECCLGIPTWQQSRGGRNRAVAREAFGAHLPHAIVDRRLKGSPQGFIQEIYQRFLPAIRERLLDGYLVASGIVDRTGLEAALRQTTRHDGSGVLRLLLLVDTEAWVRHWQTKRAISSLPAVTTSSMCGLGGYRQLSEPGTISDQTKDSTLPAHQHCTAKS
ncbi:asparagine synthase C-terminal domain-containing protein [Sphingobium sp. PNB]|uniref:asparagine synthase-related protein n=1 Tax=Sphingobium sp. PNB TaxID=863934 RepID=UPI001CA3B53A|nr:asparagine synthetase B family protein [Sphingobium sp. PNB]MCB4861613.1 asparagine synthase C-terminal domain-containing protein [Sphingobium sp. PNB]